MTRATPIFHGLFVCRRGAVLVEFALLLGVYLLVLFATFEIGLALLFTSMLSVGAERGRDYVVASRRDYVPITAAGLRAAVCNGVKSMPIACTDARMKIALIDADNAGANNLRISYPVQNRFDGDGRGQYLLAIGYQWGFSLPSTEWALPFSGPEAQIQSVSFIVASERVTG